MGQRAWIFGLSAALSCALSLGACDRLRPAAHDDGDAPTADAPDDPDAPGSDAIPQPDPADLARAQGKSNLSADEALVLYPVWMAYEHPEGGQPRWRGRALGWIFEPEEDSSVRQAFLKQVREAFGGDDAPLRSQLVVERVRPFTFDDERGEQISVQLEDQIFDARPSSAGGRFGAELRLPVTPRAQRLDPARVHQLSLKAVTKKHDERLYTAPVFLLPERGFLIVSDIDDTIKHTYVRDPAAMIRATFAEPFRFVEGMGARYGQWLAQGEQVMGAGHLHFVSASPYQLFEPLRLGIVAAGFPAATYSLRELRMDVVDLAKIGLEQSSGAGGAGGMKAPIIGDMLARLPAWKVVLVGDSGEHDPEVYGRLAKRYPEQVVGVFIRDVTGEPRDAERYAQAFEGVPAERWALFTAPAQLPAELDFAGGSAPTPAE